MTRVIDALALVGYVLISPLAWADLNDALRQHLPSRTADAISGTAFVESIRQLSLDDREAAILREITAGKFPQFLRTFKTLRLHGKASNGERLTAKIAVMSDYLAVGGNADFVRMPMTPQTAQKIADRFGCILPTRKMVDAIDATADVHLEPRPLVEDRESVETFLTHHRIIETQRAGRALGLLVTGIKKDIVLSSYIAERPDRVALYGWRKRDGEVIQPLTTVHKNRYVDYSHGARLVSDIIELEGEQRKITELLIDHELCSIVSDEGPINPPRYPTD